MYNKQLDSFIKIAEAGSFSSAADQLFISRSALIQQINLLEKELSFQLFDRHNKGVTLTPAGRYFYQEVQRLIADSKRTMQQCIALDKKTG